MKNSASRLNRITALLLILLLIVAASVLVHLFLPAARLEAVPVHSTVEALGALAALAMAAFLLMMRRGRNDLARYVWVSAALIGMGFVFFNVAVQNLAGGYGPSSERTRNFSMLALGYSGGHLVGPPIAGLAIDYYGHGAAYLCFAALTAVSMIMLACYRDLESARHAAAEAARHKVLDLLRLPALRRAVIVGGLVATGQDLYSFYVPIYGNSIGLSASTIGAVLAMAAAATFVVRFLLPWLTRRYGIEGVLSAAMFAATALFLPFPFVTSVPALCALSFCIGLALGCGQPLTLNIAYNRSPPGRSGEVAGLRLTVNNVAHIVVPVAAGALGAALGVAPVFWASAGLLATSGYFSRRTD